MDLFPASDVYMYDVIIAFFDIRNREFRAYVKNMHGRALSVRS